MRLVGKSNAIITLWKQRNLEIIPPYAHMTVVGHGIGGGVLKHDTDDLQSSMLLHLETQSFSFVLIVFTCY